MKRKEGDNPMFEQVITYMSNLMQVHMTDQVVLPSLEQLRWPVLVVDQTPRMFAFEEMGCNAQGC